MLITPEERERMSQRSILSDVKRYKEIDKQIAELESEKARLKEIICNDMEPLGETISMSTVRTLIGSYTVDKTTTERVTMKKSALPYCFQRNLQCIDVKEEVNKKKFMDLYHLGLIPDADMNGLVEVSYTTMLKIK